MANKLITFVGLLALSGSCMAGVTTYAYNPFIKTYAAAPATYVKSAPLLAAAPFAVRSAIAPLVKAEEIDPHPQYGFAYDVHDSITGDIKNQVESRDGDNVAGSYSLVDADGYKRTVTYTADEVNGFNAVVQRDPIVAKSVVAAAPVVAKYATPVLKTAPIVQASPVVRTYSAAPFVKTYAAPIVQAAAPVVPATPVIKAYAGTPVVHTAPLAKTYAAAPFVHATPVVKAFAAAPVVSTYNTAPIVRNSYFTSSPAQQLYHLPLQQQLSYLSSPAVAVHQQENLLVQQNINQGEEETQKLSAPQQPDNESTPVEYPEEAQQQEYQQHQEQQEQSQQDQEQQLIQDQQNLFAEQQQQFVAQQQQVIVQQQQLLEQQQQYFQNQQQQFANNQHFSPYPQYEIPQNQLTHPEQNNHHDAEIVEGRSVNPEKQQKEATVDPAPVNEEQKENYNKDSTKSA